MRIPTLLLVGLFLTGCGQNKPDQKAFADAIRSVVAQDQAASSHVDKSRSLWESVVGTHPDKIDDYAAMLEKLDLSRCPGDFQMAYGDHAKAWHRVAIAYRNDKDVKLVMKDVEDTWRIIMRIAAGYGVYVD